MTDQKGFFNSLKVAILNEIDEETHKVASLQSRTTNLREH